MRLLNGWTVGQIPATGGFARTQVIHPRKIAVCCALDIVIQKTLLNIIFLVAHLNPYKGLERFHERAFREEERFIIQSRPINLLQSLFSLQIFPTGSKSIQVPDVASTAAAAISNLQLRNLGIGQSGKAWQELFSHTESWK